MDQQPQDRIQGALHVLIGLPLESAGRAADLEWFSFGPVRRVTDRRGREREVGDYALHVQCAWHLAGPQGILVASRDRYHPAGDPSDEDLIHFDWKAFQWDRRGANRCDERMDRFFAEHKTPVLVESIQADALGGLQLTLSASHVLRVFPDDSLPDEHWRFFQPYRDTPHFVMTGSG